MRTRTVPWVPILALVIGIAAGLILASVVAPASSTSSSPAALRSDYKDQYREAIAAAYGYTGDLQRARARLHLLQDTDPALALAAQAQRALASGAPFEVAQELARLASDVQSGGSSVPSRTPRPPQPDETVSTIPLVVTTIPILDTTASPITPAPVTQTTSPTASPAPSLTPMPTPSAPFRLQSREDICQPGGEPGLLKVTVQDSAGRPMPGIELTITWDQGAERFFTGLQPEISAGYADYTMKGGISYSLQVARLGAPVPELTPPICTSKSGQPYLGALALFFSAP